MSSYESQVIVSMSLKKSDKLQEIGVIIGKLYTDKGLPPDMALAQLNQASKLEKLSIINGICQWLIEHKRNSGATEKSINRQRSTNRDMIKNFQKTGELGIY